MAESNGGVVHEFNNDGAAKHFSEELGCRRPWMKYRRPRTTRSLGLRRQPLDEFTLRSRGFNWVQQAPYFG